MYSVEAKQSMVESSRITSLEGGKQKPCDWPIPLPRSPTKCVQKDS